MLFEVENLLTDEELLAMRCQYTASELSLALVVAEGNECAEMPQSVARNIINDELEALFG